MIKSILEMLFKWVSERNVSTGGKIVLSLVALLQVVIVGTFVLLTQQTASATDGINHLGPMFNIVQMLITGVLVLTACAVCFYMASGRD